MLNKKYPQNITHEVKEKVLLMMTKLDLYELSGYCQIFIMFKNIIEPLSYKEYHSKLNKDPTYQKAHSNFLSVMKMLMQFKTKDSASKDVLEACVCLCVLKLDCFITRENTELLPSILSYFMDFTIT